jgi:hypothetical protein
MRYRLPAPSGQRCFTTAIARMLGKAVKVRHCPATVSAPARPARRMGVGKAGFQPGFFAHANKDPDGNHWRRAAGGSLLGRWLKKAQVRRPVLGAFTRLRSEGNEGAIMPVSALLRGLLKPRLSASLL